MLAVRDVKKASSISEVIDSCLSGDTVLLITGAGEGLVINNKGWESRSIQEPQTESSAGCWDRRELDNLAIVSGVGIDQSGEPGEFQLTI